MPLGDYSLLSSGDSCVLLQSLGSGPFVVWSEPFVTVKNVFDCAASHFGKADTEVAECEEGSELLVVLSD